MKYFLSIIKTIVICVICFFLYNCEGEDQKYEGNFLLRDETRGYIIKDTVSATFKMIDNHDIVDEFSNSNGYMNIYLGSTGTIFKIQQQFMLVSISLLNNYTFRYELLADKESDQMKIYVSPLSFFDPAVYDFASKKVSTNQDPLPEIKFYDEMEVRGIVYHKIIEIDYSKDQDKLKNNFPVHIYYSTDKGLIKFIRKDGIFFERIQE
jgi:hypothetical protein